MIEISEVDKMVEEVVDIQERHTERKNNIKEARKKG